ncbi:hypothetical protein BDZ89DRAFT_963604, partial [Hymenopellis radicata]
MAANSAAPDPLRAGKKSSSKGRGAAHSASPSEDESESSSSCSESSREDSLKDDHWTYPLPVKETGVPDGPDEEDEAHLLVGMDEEMKRRFVEGYAKDRSLKNYYVTEIANPSTPLTPSRFVKGSNGLLYFIDADWKHRLCVPSSLIPEILKRMHETAYESAHEG